MTEHHRNAQVYWPEITCQRGHTEHVTKRVTVDLSKPHEYHDHASVPAGLAPAPFDMLIYDPALYPVDNGAYCPAHDAVSATIDTLHIWEPEATILALHVLSSVPAPLVVDYGCQIGWFSLLAASCGAVVCAIDADPENLCLLDASAELNGWHEGDIASCVERVGPESELFELPPEGGFRFVKIDVEGAEVDAVRTLWPAIEAGLVDHMLIEVSPVFIPGDTYPDLVQRIIDAGYRAYVFPQPSQPPPSLDDPERDMVRIDTRPDLREFIRDCRQTDVWFRREDAAW